MSDTATPQAAPRPLVLPAVVPVAGISLRPGAASRTRVGDVVCVRPEPENPHDPNALALHTSDGDKLGYVPAALAVRLTHLDAAQLRGEVVDVLDTRGTIGLRVRLTGVEG